MGAGLRDFAPHIVAMLAGGLIASFGLPWLARRRGQNLLSRLRLPWIAVLGVLAVGAGGFGVWWMVQKVLDSATTDTMFASPPQLFAFGLAIGLPLALPGLLMTWNAVRPEKVAERGRRIASATKDDRREFARGLAEQIREASVESRELQIRVGGDGGRVLQFEGDLKRDEGERLTAALRVEMKELGFKRVEGEDPAGRWWTRV